MSYHSKILTATLLTLGLSSIIENSMFRPNINVIQPPSTVSIIMASYNEEDTIQQSLQSLTSQSIIQQYPNHFEIILVDSQSTDNTLYLAEPFVDKIIISPKGKLTARTLAINQSQCNIIVSTDADTIYPYHWLNTLLEPFNNPKYHPSTHHPIPVVATSGNTYDYTIPFIPGPVHTLIYYIDRTLLHTNQLPGRNSAFWKRYFYLSGGFNIQSTNQLSIGEMYQEEEINFGNRLSKFGRIIFKNNATCIHLNGKRIAARLGLSNKTKQKYQLGIDRF